MPDPRAMGFDAAVEFPPHGVRAQTLTAQIERINPAYQGDVWDYISAAQNAIARPAPDYQLFRGVMTGWDNTPRLQNNAQVFVNAHPDNYRRWLAAIVAETRKRKSPDEPMVFVNAWNEWAEGCHLEPDQTFGRGYLEATKAALSAGP
jgi:lipopolysaccharide biosynthesis protein